MQCLLTFPIDCLDHELLVAKLEAYGFDFQSLAYIYSHLSHRKQRTKVNKTFSALSDIKFGVPQGSKLGPLLFNVYVNDTFYFVGSSDVANYADDTTPYTVNKTMDALLNSLENDTSTLTRWFHDNYLKMNIHKCHLVSSHEVVSITVDQQVMNCSNSVKLLGVTIDNNLSFDTHVSKFCGKVSLKWHALARISNFMNHDKLRLILKAFVESQFGYCPLVWMFHSRAVNNRINRLHERAPRLVYRASQLTFKELLRKDGSFEIHHRNLQKLATDVQGKKLSRSDTRPCTCQE